MWGGEKKANGVGGEKDVGDQESKQAGKQVPSFIGICIGQGLPPSLPAFLPPSLPHSLPFLHGVEESNGFSVQRGVGKCIDELQIDEGITLPVDLAAE